MHTCSQYASTIIIIIIIIILHVSAFSGSSSWRHQERLKHVGENNNNYNTNQ